MSVITYQYRIKDSQHRNHLLHMSWAVNRVWNYLNDVSMLAWRRERKFLSAFELQRLTAGCGKDLGLHSQTVQAICDEYVARRRSVRKIRLHWRSFKRSLGWIPFYNQAIRIEGEAVIFRQRTYALWLSRGIGGRVKFGSFTQDARGRWYLNLNCEVADQPQFQLGLDAVGIDLGLKDQIACSDGVIYNRQNLTRQYEDDLAMAQRAGKKHRIKSIHAKIKNVRKDWTHKVTTAIARHYSFIAVGDVSSTQMAKTKMARSTYDAGWGMIRHQLTYKAIRLAGVCVPVRESFSSITCSGCFARSGPSGLSALGVREWTCSPCGISHHRDINAAHNILRLGRQTLTKGIPRL